MIRASLQFGTRTSRAWRVNHRMMSNIATTTKGVVLEKTGGPEVLQYKTDLPVPELKDGELLIKNEYIGVNFIDTYFRSGLYPAPSFPHILGHEASGQVLATGAGDTHGLSVGDRVIWLDYSAYQEHCVVSSGKAIRIPEPIDNKTAAACMFQALTALTLIREAHKVQPGDWVLVHAAAGGVGSWLCQLLRAIGAHTIGTASTEEKLEMARARGAEVLVNYAKDDVVKKVQEVTHGKGVAAVFDGVGKATFDISLDCVARKGSLVCFGNASGPVPPFNILRLSEKNVKLVRTNLVKYLATREELEHFVNEVFYFMDKHKLDAQIHGVYPLSEAAQAHRDLEGRKTSGKLLLKP